MLITIDEKNILNLRLEDTKAEYRAKIIMLKEEGYTVLQIRKTTNHCDYNVRKWIHKFNEQEIDNIVSKTRSYTVKIYYSSIESF